VPRPRLYEDAALTELEAQIVERVMTVWGYDGAKDDAAA
ncbi:MAG: hypothetical protein QOI64_1957, partial [Solirubrobacteraceae bacterium]|nr:hypothetical protein [Solirubrobacteraceae bacterium]